MNEYSYVTLRQVPELKEPAAAWFHAKWGVPQEAYLECMESYLKNKTEAQVNFVMIAYYNPNETYEEHDEYSYDDMNKVEYEMQLVKVGDVWRVNKYHSPELG